MITHQQIDRRSEALAREIAAKLRDDPTLLEQGREALARWNGNSRYEAEWRALIEQPLDVILAHYLEESDRGKELRQSAPFGSILSPVERTMILRRFHDPGAA